MTVSVAAATSGNNSTDTDITVKDTDDGNTGDQTGAITFTTINWNTARTIKLEAGADTDAANGLRDITHTATSTDTTYNNVSIRLTATESDITTQALSVTSVSSSGATLNLDPTGEAWYYKRIEPTGVNTCHSVAKGTTTAVLSTLTSGTLYGYTAYSDSACTSANAHDTIYFSATDAGVSNLGEDAPSTACSIGKTFNSDTTCAVSFTTDDANTAGYALRSVTTRFNAKSGSPSNIIVGIHKADTIATAATRHRPPQSR